MNDSFNYKQLCYFWAIAKKGSFSRAKNKLSMTAQTVCVQVSELEHSLGCELLKLADGTWVCT